MQKLSLIDTQELVNSYVKSFGQSGAARKLTEIGYRSPSGSSILQAHIFRILHGSDTCLLAPETENQEQESPITEKPPAAIPKRARQIAEELFADEKMLEQEIVKVGEELRKELEDEQRALEEMERALPPLVPIIGNRPYLEARHLERYVRVSGVFSPRNSIELDEDHNFFGIPRLKRKPPAIVSKPYQQRRYGQNVISTRDLCVRQK